MEELLSSNVQVVLSIKEGKNFDQVLHSTAIVATLNGHSLETDVIEPNSNPQIETDLVWEIDKNKLRKMRSGQVPLKIECFIIRGNENKEKLGYFLLGLRSAQIVPKNSNVHIKSNWHKLLGLKNDFKSQKPELLVALSIHEQESVTPNMQLEPNHSEKYYETLSEYNHMVPILLHDERLIQLGPLNTCHDLFLISITAISVTNISSLLELERNGKNDLNFMCRIFENDIYFKPFQTDLEEEVWVLNEKIVIRIRTSLKVLKEYLKSKPYLSVNLRYKDNTIAKSEVDLQSLVPTDNIQEFLNVTQNNSILLNERCFLQTNNVTESNAMQLRRPYLDIQLKLQYVGVKVNAIETSCTLPTSNDNALSSMTNLSMKQQKDNFSQIVSLTHVAHTFILQRYVQLQGILEYPSCIELNFQHPCEIDSHRNPGGDFGKCNMTMAYPLNYPNECHHKKKYSSSCEVLKSQPIKTVYSQSADTVMCQCNNKDCSKSVEAYHCYCLNIALCAIKLIAPNLSGSNIEIRFHHPKTEVISTFFPKATIFTGETVKFQEIECKLHFISATDEIKHLLLSFPPKISIHNAEEHKTCISQFIVDLAPLFSQKKFECQYDITLYSTEHNNIGNVDVALSLEDHGPYYRIKRRTSNESLGPPILDDTLAYKIVDELETWKERQKEIFKVELKRKEERHLNLLSEEWQKHRESLESKLACSVEQCKMLANSLNNATEDLRIRRLKSLEKEARLIKANEDLQYRYEAKIQELKESYRTMQEELTAKINALEKRKTTLEAQVEPLSVENERLRLTVAKQQEELEIYKKGSLTQDQTANLLQELKALEEKLHNAQESKSFFKEQWAKAVREIHRMKMEHQQSIQVQIKNSKEELQNIDLEEILCTDSTALTNDQILLGEIQKEIDVIKPKPSLGEGDIYNQVFTPATNIGSTITQNNNKATSKRSDEYSERLQALIEERDSLLKTGSYTIDDTVIIKLNNEIRSLMMR